MNLRAQVETVCIISQMSCFVLKTQQFENVINFSAQPIIKRIIAEIMFYNINN